MLYRIYTEDLQRDLIAKLISASFDSFTLLEGIGYWKGAAERCLIIEIITPDSTPEGRKIVERVACRVKELNAQEAVLLTHSTLSQELI